MAFQLATLSVASLLALVPPGRTKIVVDYVLNDGPLPETVSDWAPREPWNLLVVICIGIVVISEAIREGVVLPPQTFVATRVASFRCTFDATL